MYVPDSQVESTPEANNADIDPKQDRRQPMTAPRPATPLCDKLRAADAWNPKWEPILQEELAAREPAGEAAVL